MYTQCPECKVAFKVTAGDLKQASGRVRCGGCNETFNALMHLSEEKPQPADSAGTVAAPELKSEAVTAKQDAASAISARDSAALLKTLDDLDGDDIRIEDTGDEWRVFDDDDPDAARAAIDELRFDDNTPLPAEFASIEESALRAVSEPEPMADDESVEPVEEVAEEISLGEPDEWQDILGEFQDLEENAAAPAEPDEAAALAPETDTDDLADFAESAVDIDDDDEDTVVDIARYADIPEKAVEDAANDETPDDDDAELVIDLTDDLIADADANAENDMDDIVFDENTSDDPIRELSEKEQTVEMEIDQELMSLAIEDKDGHRSTIAPLDDVDTDQYDDDAKSSQGTAPGFETIVMEGETIRTKVNREKMLADMAEAAAMVEKAKTDEAEQKKLNRSPRYGMIATLVLLIFVLAGQIIHQSRDTLATIPMFNDTVGQLYRALGQPIQPAWDITGWRFEATKGSTDGDDEDLTVFSRLGNNSGGPLPYPIISIALTDRFEESIGSRVLDPADYLPDDLDPRKLVEPGSTFDAVITIKSPSRDATGFKLNVCYRLTSGRLRCAVDDFK